MILKFQFQIKLIIFFHTIRNVIYLNPFLLKIQIFHTLQIIHNFHQAYKNLNNY